MALSQGERDDFIAQTMQHVWLAESVLQESSNFWWAELKFADWRIHRIKRTFTQSLSANQIFWVPMVSPPAASASDIHTLNFVESRALTLKEHWHARIA